MSEATLRHVMSRIDGATKQSPIAVFRSEFRGKLNAVFGATLHTIQLIDSKDKTYIGSYHKEMDIDAVEKKLAGFIA